jgi:nucleoid-associated protein YgaU
LSLDALIFRAAVLPDRLAVVSRRQKLLAAGVVLGVGLATAMLFRRGDETLRPAVVSAVPVESIVPVAPTPVLMPLEGQFSPLPPVPATMVSSVVSVEPSPAIPAITVDATPPVVVESDPLATPSTEAPAGRPVYAVEDPAEIAAPTADSGYRVHVIHNGDTLERLAERYLTDGARALELFDLNRDVLENPHLLPLGVELRIPVGAPAGAVAE